MEAKDEINNKMIRALSGLRVGSQESYRAARDVINSLFADGLLACPPEWKSDFEVEMKLRPEIQQIDISVIIKK